MWSFHMKLKKIDMNNNITKVQTKSNLIQKKLQSKLNTNNSPRCAIVYLNNLQIVYYYTGINSPFSQRLSSKIFLIGITINISRTYR